LARQKGEGKFRKCSLADITIPTGKALLWWLGEVTSGDWYEKENCLNCQADG